MSVDVNNMCFLSLNHVAEERERASESREREERRGAERRLCLHSDEGQHVVDANQSLLRESGSNVPKHASESYKKQNIEMMMMMMIRVARPTCSDRNRKRRAEGRDKSSRRTTDTK